jgi:CDP-paratose 2-epimerase
VFNIGGGPSKTLSLLELIDHLQDRLGHRVQHELAAWRSGDQRVYVSDITKARAELDWEPTVGVSPGIDELLAWLRHDRLIGSEARL